MTVSLDQIAARRFERAQAQNDPSREWDEPAPRAVNPDRFKSAIALRGFQEMTDFKVTAETFAKEERRKSLDVEGERADVPPPGMTCSARLGAVSTLL